jgi:hypothetical protein
MLDDLLKNLIREADARPQAAGGSPAELAARVRALYLRRKRRRWAASAAAVVLLGCLLWRIAPRGHVRQGEEPSPEVAIVTEIARAPSGPSPRAGISAAGVPPSSFSLPAQSESSLHALAAQIDREERIVRRLLLAERVRRLTIEAREISGRMTPPATRDELVGPVAAGYLVSGDHKRAAGLPAASARHDYARVVELFPGTSWADQAKARLASLKP